MPRKGKEMTSVPQEVLRGIKALLINLDDRLINVYCKNREFSRPLTPDEVDSMIKEIEDNMASLDEYVKPID